MNYLKSSIIAVALLLVTAQAFAQVASPVPPTMVQPVISYYALIPISATAAVNVVTTLTIPAPAPNLYNYVCYLGLNVSQDGTSTANSNKVSSSTNFNSFAHKWSLPATANLSYDWSARWGNPATGCAKSTLPGTATTFVSPQTANSAHTWYATYYQAP